MGGYSPYARYQPPYATVPMGLVRLLVDKGVGRNGWAVMAALSCGVHENGVLDVQSAASACEMTGLTRNQVARGMAELRDKGVIAPCPRRPRSAWSRTCGAGRGTCSRSRSGGRTT